MIDFFAKITFILKRHSLTILVFYLIAEAYIQHIHPISVVHNLFYISYHLIKQDYQIYPQYTSQWCSFFDNTKLTLLQFTMIFLLCIGYNLCFSKFTLLEDEKFTPRY